MPNEPHQEPDRRQGQTDRRKYHEAPESRVPTFYEQISDLRQSMLRYRQGLDQHYKVFRHDYDTFKAIQTGQTHALKKRQSNQSVWLKAAIGLGIINLLLTVLWRH